MQIELNFEVNDNNNVILTGVTDVIKINLNSKENSGFHLITGEILKQISRKVTVILAYYSMQF